MLLCIGYMNSHDRQQLDRMIRDGEVEDVTDCIRDRKHSATLRQELENIQWLLGSEYTNQEGFDNRCEAAAPFMFRNYTDIYNRARKGNLDFAIMGQFVDVLARIEEGELGQHEGAHEVGTLLKKLYIDSAVKQADKLDEANSTAVSERAQSPLSISYAEFKDRPSANL